MKNISNQEIDAEKCTHCPTCGKASWYVHECDCGTYVCEYCSAEKADKETENIQITCPKCGKSILYV